jgi:hypothetical protein
MFGVQVSHPNCQQSLENPQKNKMHVVMGKTRDHVDI